MPDQHHSDGEEEISLQIRIGQDTWRLRSQNNEMFDYASANLHTLDETFEGHQVTPSAANSRNLLDSLAGQTCIPYIQEISSDECVLDISHVIAGASALWQAAAQIEKRMPEANPVAAALHLQALLQIAVVNDVLFQTTVADLADDDEFHAAVRAHTNHPAYGSTNDEDNETDV